MIPDPVLGDLLCDAASRAKGRVLLCAPFSKAAVLERLLGFVSSGIEVELFTRWQPDEVAAGVSDTEVLPLLEEHGGSVFLCESLHAKAFCFDDRALVGSANLTDSDLGWSPSPNLELLLEVSASSPGVIAL